jgi:gliding motility-associated protein GldL
MGLNFVRSKGYKNFMSKLYGWGAAVVILGALFKINHYPGANTMLIIGLGTEALIFFFSAFEPPHVEPDWSLVYPELAGMYNEGDINQKPSLKNKDLTKELDKMLSDAKIGPELIQSLSKGLHSMSENATKLADISSAADATSDYTKNLKTASQSVGELSNAYKKTSDAMAMDVQASTEYSASLKNVSASVNNLAGTYNNASEAMKSDLNVTKGLMSNFVAASDSAKVLTDQYTKSAEILAKSAASIDFTALESGAYGKELNRISTNLNALNAIYELQLKSSTQQVETANQLQAKFDSFIKNINESIDKTARYKDGVDLLAQNVAALNKVYGNMLTAMNVNVAK